MLEAVMGGAAGAGAQVDVVALGPTQRRVELRGALPVGWAGRLASGLAAQRIDIVRGWAVERGGAGWEAQFEIVLPPSTGLTPALVLQLTEPEATPLRTAIGLELLAHRLTRSGPDVVVEIEAADGRGFLDRTLRLFALYGLFPREMQIETVEGMVRDVFRLRSMHGGAPEPSTTAALESKLRRITLP